MCGIVEGVDIIGKFNEGGFKVMPMDNRAIRDDILRQVFGWILNSGSNARGSLEELWRIIAMISL
jgi:hypothetical protein